MGLRKHLARDVYTDDALGDNQLSLGGDDADHFELDGFTLKLRTDALLDHETTHRQDAILAIKKPDYLGDSQWDFRSGQTPVRAPIGDSDWLTSFRQRRFEIKPGDSLRVLLGTQVGQDADGNVLEPRYRVLKVYGVVHGDAPGQPEFEMGDDVGRG